MLSLEFFRSLSPRSRFLIKIEKDYPVLSYFKCEIFEVIFEVLILILTFYDFTNLNGKKPPFSKLKNIFYFIKLSILFY